MLCTKFGWNWPSGSGEEEFLISSMYFRFFVIIPPWRWAGPFISTNLRMSSSHKNALCQVWLKLAQRFWWKRFFIFVNVISLFRNYLPWEKGRGLLLNKLESSSPQNALCQVWLKLTLWFWRRRGCFFISSKYFPLFRNYLPLEKDVALHLINLNPLHTKMLCAKFGWNWSSGCG